MSLMEDHLTKESVERLHEAFMEGVLELERTKAGDIGLNNQTFNEVGVPIIRYVHTKLWQASKANQTGQLIDFPRVTDGSISVNGILMEEGIDHRKKGHSTKLAADVARLLQYAGIAVHRRPRWFLKPFDEERVEWVTHETYKERRDPKVEKRIKEHANSPIKSKIDLRSIKRPEEFTAEEVAAFIERFVPAALKLQDEFEAHLAEEAEQEAEKAEAEAWKGVGSKLDEALGETSS